MGNLYKILEIKKEKTDKNIVINIKKNPIGTTLKLVGRIIMVVGILAGLLIGSLLTVPAPPLNWAYGLTIMVSSFISGLLFIGFGEIIILLNDIKYNTNKL